MNYREAVIIVGTSLSIAAVVMAAIISEQLLVDTCCKCFP